MKNFETRVFGKWILAGEHSVLRGSPALVFPLKSKFLELSYEAQPGRRDPLTIELQGEHGGELQLLVWGVLERACELKKLLRHDLYGKITLRSTIPVGAGMGASAALCVAISRWFNFLKIISEAELYEFSRTLENLFHGESSGVDIAVALSNTGLHFERSGVREQIAMKWTPKLYISYSGKRGVTLECVNKVKSWIAQNPEEGMKTDETMKSAVLLCEKALSVSEKEGFQMLVEAIEQAETCFEKWKLIEGQPHAHIQWLRDQGAAAVKVTGSGDGGYVLSLWDREPPAECLRRLIACN